MSSIASLGWFMTLMKVKLSPIRWGVMKFHVLDPSRKARQHTSDCEAPFISNINLCVLKSPQVTQALSQSCLQAAISSQHYNFSLNRWSIDTGEVPRKRVVRMDKSIDDRVSLYSHHYL